MNAMTEAIHCVSIDEMPAERTAALPIALRDDERQPCEVWTRVMGYHRPVASFNIGKKGEHRERRFFSESHAHRSCAEPA